MHLPIHPDVCYEYIKALKESGYQWLMVQEHTIENMDGSRIRQPHTPHMLVARNSLGEEVRIVALVKTQGSDTKLVAQMQPYYEAKSTGMQSVLTKLLLSIFVLCSQSILAFDSDEVEKIVAGSTVYELQQNLRKAEFMRNVGIPLAACGVVSTPTASGHNRMGVRQRPAGVHGRLVLPQ